MQNEFQEKVLKLAAQCECAAVDFLKRSDGLSSLAVIRLQDVREKEVISYQWTDDILFHSHHDTDYGHGQVLQLLFFFCFKFLGCFAFVRSGRPKITGSC